jgi:hypothetical protein
MFGFIYFNPDRILAKQLTITGLGEDRYHFDDWPPCSPDIKLITMLRSRKVIDY